MPSLPRKACPTFGCPHFQPCPTHLREKHRRYDAQRGTVKQRGYAGLWRDLRKLVLHRDPICKLCGERASSTADHIVRRAVGGDDGMENLQGVCWPCHQVKRGQEAHQ